MQPFIFGHRGCAYEPENTLRSFRKAIDLGVDGIELDVRKCKSGHIVVIHDEKVDRTTNGKGYVKNLTLKKLKKLGAGRNESIPTLEEVFKFLNKHKKVKFVIELKEGIEKDIVKIIKKYKLMDKVIIISFHHRFIRNLKMLHGDIHSGILFVGNPVKVMGIAQDAHANYLFLNYKYVNKNTVKDAHENNLKVYVWNVDDVENLKKILKLNVDGIGSNKPDIVINYLKNKK